MLRGTSWRKASYLIVRKQQQRKQQQRQQQRLRALRKSRLLKQSVLV
jgi:hypothetical protein